MQQHLALLGNTLVSFATGNGARSIGGGDGGGCHFRGSFDEVSAWTNGGYVDWTFRGPLPTRTHL